MKKMTCSDYITNVLQNRYKLFEKELSTRDRSVREIKFGPHRIMHRFPIKDGLTIQNLFAENLCKNNSFLSRLKEKKNGIR